MKKRVGFITLDFSLASWLSKSLQTCPCTHGAELREGLEDLMSGGYSPLRRSRHRPEAAPGQPGGNRNFPDPKGV